MEVSTVCVLPSSACFGSFCTIVWTQVKENICALLCKIQKGEQLADFQLRACNHCGFTVVSVIYSAPIYPIFNISRDIFALREFKR